ncbi:MAG: MMPL family transporter, partial [Gammaproteobacteria bacterium]|nr:MMPL family transporter [Gammaproteobacteria bacterium]
SQFDLMLTTVRKMVWPCLYTALTTIIAFLSLVFSDIKPVIDFGWMMTIGLTVTFATSFLLFPTLLVMMGRLAPVAEKPAGSRIMSLLSRFTERNGTVILLLSAALVVLSVAGVYRLRVENSFIDYFSTETEIYQGMKLIDDQLGGTTPLDIVIGFTSGATEEATESEADEEFDEIDDLLEDDEEDPAQHWFTPQKIDLVKRVHDYLDGLPETGKVLSLASLIRVAEDLNEGKPFSGMELAVLYKRMPDQIRREMIEPFVSIDDNETRISLRVFDSRPELRRNELLQKLRRDLTGEFGLQPDQVTVTGVLVLYNNMLQSLFRSQIQTLGVVMLGVAITLVLLFRSVPLAIIGIVPNLLAAGVILGLMGLLNIPLDMMTITIAAITIGIAVDNSIHYIYRFREEYPRTNDYVSTLHYCHANIGRAVFYTAITIIVGFSILVMSNFIPTIYFGTFTALAMAIALLAALTLLPRLIMLWRPF